MRVYSKNIILIFSLVFLTGCTTTPVREAVSLKGPAYNIGNMPYVPLNSVIDAYGLDYNWDSIAKKITLYKGDKEVILCLGSNTALINGQTKNLSEPVKMKDGVIVFPNDFALSELEKIFIIKQLYARTGAEKRISAPGVYSIKKIVIDPGHGGKDPGAIGQFGLREKDIALDVARRLRYYLADSGIEVVLTREDDRFISLWKRSDIANKEDADFFISIHANACRAKNVGGFEVYYLSEAVDDNARAVAAAENASLRYENSSFGNKKPSTSLEATLWDIEYTENREESAELAGYIATSADRKLTVKNRGVKAARFYVLKGAKMPSILIEIGFISNRTEAEKIKSAEYREMIAKSIASGIIDYKREYERTEGFTR